LLLSPFTGLISMWAYGTAALFDESVHHREGQGLEWPGRLMAGDFVGKVQ
jgi:hypothetical protein